jgi:hypothetical protein
MAISNSGRGKRRILTPEEVDHGDAIEEVDEETLLDIQFGHIPGRLPDGWAARSETAFDKEISLDHATEVEWQRFLDSLDEEE